MSDALTEPQFRLAADEALAALEESLIPLCDEHDVELERRNGVLQVVFEAPPSTFVISPNAPVRQIWVSALSRSFKLSWAPELGTFALNGEALESLLTRLVRQNLGL